MSVRWRGLAGIAAALLSLASSAAARDFVCKIRAEGNGGDFVSLSAWNDAIRSDLTAASSLVFAVSDRGSYDPGVDNGATVTFTGGGAGTLKHLSTYDFAYVVDVAGTVEAGAVALSGSGHTFVVSDTGEQIARAIAECYNDWPSGLNDRPQIAGWTTSAERHVKIFVPPDHRHNGSALISGGVFAGFGIVQGGWNYHNSLYINTPFTVVDGMIVRVTNDAGNSSAIGINQRAIVKNCVIKGHWIRVYAGADGTVIVNSVVSDAPAAMRGPSGAYSTSVHVYNCTFADNAEGVNLYAQYGSAKTSFFRNVLSNNPTNDFAASGSMQLRLENCASSDGTAGDHVGAANRVNQTFSFADAANRNYRLAREDKGARFHGADLRQDPVYPFAADILGEPRRRLWDIGAFQLPVPGGTVAVFR